LFTIVFTIKGIPSPSLVLPLPKGGGGYRRETLIPQKGGYRGFLQLFPLLLEGYKWDSFISSPSLREGEEVGNLNPLKGGYRGLSQILPSLWKRGI